MMSRSNEFARLATLFKQCRALAAGDSLPAQTLSLMARVLSIDLDVRPNLSQNERAELKRLIALPPPGECRSDTAFVSFEALLSRCVQLGVLSPAQHVAINALRDEATHKDDDDAADDGGDGSDSWSLVSDASSWAVAEGDEAAHESATLYARLSPLTSELGESAISQLVEMARQTAAGNGQCSGGVTCQLPRLDADASTQYTVRILPTPSHADDTAPTINESPPHLHRAQVLTVHVSAPDGGTRRDELVLSEAGTCVGAALPLAAALDTIVRMMAVHHEAQRLSRLRASLERPTYATGPCRHRTARTGY